MSTENSLRNAQPQGIECEYREHSQNSWIPQQQNKIDRGQTQRNGNNAALHSDLREDSQNSLRMTPIS